MCRTGCDSRWTSCEAVLVLRTMHMEGATLCQGVRNAQPYEF